MVNSSFIQPDALALDFDGVVCNGLREYFQTSLKAYAQIASKIGASEIAAPEIDIEQSQTWEPLFGQLRPVVETGWEMPLLLKAIHEGYEVETLLLSWPQIRDRLLTQFQLSPKQLGALVDKTRDQWMTEDLDGWLALHAFYPGVDRQLQHWLSQGLPLWIITTKESRFVDALLQQSSIQFPKEAIFGKDAQQPKSETLRQIQAQGFSKIWFVEDRLETLLGIQQQPDLQSVSLFLGDWGYNTEGDRQRAKAHKTLHLLSLSQFCQPVAHWLEAQD
ncbi:MAG: HAD family hydrolase [Thermosynechococcaceae cyanobacterium MS004]|nr:HAD family hydrolase [Thermosynechococcaceae cyanobacterium MS004]